MSPLLLQDFRQRLAAQGDSIAEEAKGISESLRSLKAPQAGPASKLVSDFKQVLSDFQQAQRLCVDREATCFPMRAKTPLKDVTRPLDGVREAFRSAVREASGRRARNALAALPV